MIISLVTKYDLPGIPSASGIEIIDDDVYIMSDDSPWLYRLDLQLNIAGKIRIADPGAAIEGKIPKKIKPDLEAMCHVGNELWLFGSGSKGKERETMIVVGMNEEKVSAEYSLSLLYEEIRRVGSIEKKDLNIEAAAFNGEYLFLLNRGKNLCFRINAQEFLDHVKKKAKFPSVEIFNFILPEIKGIPAGFSGACLTPDGKGLLFTASVENTSNWIDDGEVLGSFIGLIDINKPQPGVLSCELLPLKEKVESVAVRSAGDDEVILWLVTDNDDQGSVLVTCRWIVDQ